MIKCEAFRAFYRFFATNFNKFNKTGARMLDSVYHITLKLLKMNFWRENIKILPFLRNVIMNVITLRY